MYYNHHDFLITFEKNKKSTAEKQAWYEHLYMKH